MSGQFSHLARPVLLYELGIIPYQRAWTWQRQLVAQRKQDSTQPDVLMLLEHPPVYTLGQGSSEAFLKFDLDATDFALHRIERGGEVTYHCPGQLVGYPILNLRYHRQDLHWYLRGLESVLIDALGKYDLPAQRLDGLTGVWIEGYKVAAIGIKVSRWITMHGFALNICPDLTGFQKIVPCGIEDRPVGSLVQFIPQLKFADVSDAVQRSFEKVFGVKLQPAKWLGDEG
ncbi:MAG: lipoyl(octanoyl) transferase LipB [Cyanobacteria bacterium J06635_1]